jgi:hypothetical protein
MKGTGADAVLDSFNRQMKRLPAALRKSMTYDRSSEMACHPEPAQRLKIDIWFHDPHAPWQRGSNEHKRITKAVHAKGERLGRCQPNLAQRRRRLDEQPPTKDTGLENTRLSHGRRNRGLQINRCT